MNQLSSCNQLIELEPDSKWTLLTRIFLMICIDKWKYEKDIKSGLEKLKEIDPLRKGYYSDLRGRVTVQMAIMKEEGKKSFVLTGQNLAWIYHPQCFHSFEEIDLSQNELSSESLNQFYTLVNCKRLNLSDNKIKNLLHFPVLPNLEILLIENNLIEEIDLERFKKFPQLKHVGLSGNPIVEKMQSILDLTNDLGKIKFDYLES